MARTPLEPLSRFDRRPPHPEATFEQRVQWIREGARWLVRSIALDEVLAPVGLNRAHIEALERCQDIGSLIKASNAEIIAAAEQELSAQLVYCGDWLEMLRRTLWWRCKARQSPVAITEAATKLSINWDVPVSDEQLRGVLFGLWEAAAPRPSEKPKRGPHGTSRRR